MSELDKIEINRDGTNQSPSYDIESGLVPGLQEIPEVEKGPSQEYVPEYDGNVTNVDTFIDEQNKKDKERDSV